MKLCCALFTFLALLWGTPASAAAKSPPNFVVVFCDDLGYGDLGCFGNPTIRTPHLDRMAVEGQKWTQFYVGASVCTPSRAALMTGRLPVRNGMMSARRRVLFPNSKGGLPASETTIAELLKPAGYATAAVGKWHLGHLPQYLPTAHGFDSYWGIPYSNDMDAVRGFPNYRQNARRDPNYMPTIDQYQVPLLADTTVIEQPADQTTITRRYAEQAVQFIKHNAEQPFFLYLAHNLPHIPLFASDEFRGNSPRGLYGDVVEEIDAGVGQILQTLRDLKLAENTVVVFTSDNGPWLPFHTHGGSAGLLREGKGTTFEGGMREPTLFWGPGRVAPGTVTALGTTMDLLPTFCHLADVELPADLQLDGYNLSPVLLGETNAGPRNEVYYWRQEQLYAVRSGPWKAHFISAGCYGIGPQKQTHDPPLLYHLEHDPSEKYDVAGDHPAVIETLKQLAAAHRDTITPVENELER